MVMNHLKFTAYICFGYHEIRFLKYEEEILEAPNKCTICIT